VVAEDEEVKEEKEEEEEHTEKIYNEKQLIR
jgi:hypothetical protein